MVDFNKLTDLLTKIDKVIFNDRDVWSVFVIRLITSVELNVVCGR